MIKALFAVSSNGCIGKNNDIPWPRIDADMKFFRNTTMDGTIVMGRKTFDSLPNILERREHIVCTKNKNLNIENVKVINNVELEFERMRISNEIYYFIGGAKLLKTVAKYIDIFLITELSESYDGDVYIDERYRELPNTTLLSFEKNSSNASAGIIKEYRRF